MSIEVTVRHLDINESLQGYAREKANKLKGDFSAIEFVRVVLDKDGPFYTANIFVQGGQRTSVDGINKDADIIGAINGAFEKVEAMLRKNAKKLHNPRN